MTGNYIIAVDENGQAYIAHASGIGSWKNKAVKYIKKIKDGNRTRYFYSQKEIDTYNANKANEKGSRYVSQALHALSHPMQYEFTGNGPLGQLGRKKKKEAMDKIGKELKLMADSSESNSLESGKTDWSGKRPTSHKKNVTGTAKKDWAYRREIDESPVDENGKYTERGKRRAVEKMQARVEKLKDIQKSNDEDIFYHNQLLINFNDTKGLDKIAIRKNIKQLEKDIADRQKEYDRIYNVLLDDIELFKNGTYWDYYVW